MSPLLSRVAVIAAGLPLVLFAAYYGGWALLALVAPATLLALHELYGMARALRPLVLAGYGGDLGGRTRIRLLKDLEMPIGGRDVLLVENVVDTGLTLNYVVKTLSLREPRDIAVCTLFDRPYRRLVDDLPMRYVGFTIPDQFFLGYGFDLHERFRGLPDLHVSEQD